MLIALTPLFSLLVLINIIGYAFILKRIIKIETTDIFENVIIGAIFLIFFSYLINFFLPLSSIITNSFFIIFTFIGLVSLSKKNVQISYIKIISLIFILTLITIFSKSYNDYELYHLPYIEILREFKIIFGLSNFDFRYGHSSVFQNISAFQYNSIMGYDSYIFFPVLIFLLSLLYLFEKIYSTSNINIFFIGLVSFIFFAIHGSRFGALGNDYPTHILAIISIIYFLDLKNQKSMDSSKIFIFFSLCFIIIVSKFSLVFYLLPVVYLFFVKKFEIFKSLSLFRILFLATLTLFFFTKNIINTSCLIYPIPKLCLDTSWSIDKFSFSSPETISILSSIHVKNYWHSDHLLKPEKKNNFKKKLLSDDKIFNEYSRLNKFGKEEFLNYYFFKDYLKFKNWTKFYFLDSDFYKLLKDIILLNFLLFIIFISILYKKDNFDFYNFKNFRFLIKESSFLIFFIFFTFLLWFLNFPQLRYGFSYCLLFFLMPKLFFFSNFDVLNLREYLSKTVKIIFSIILIYVLYSNMLRIYKDFQNIDINSGSSNIVPLYSNHGFNVIDVDGFELKQPNKLCSNIKQLCSVFTDRFVDADRKIYKNSYNYLILK